MSDLFKDHKPELSEEEDRLLWQRVRAIPALETAPAFRPVPWWRRLWSTPAVRFGAPALAVLVAAVVWVIEREPAYKPEPVSVRQEEPSAARVAPPPSAQMPVAQPVPAPERATTGAARPQANERLAAIAAKDAPEGAGSRADASGPAAAQDEDVAEESATTLSKSAPAPTPTAPTATTFATPPPATATRERKQSAESAPPAQDSKAEAKPQWGSVKSNYRDSGNTAQQGLVQILSVSDQLVQGRLPAPAQLTDHPLLKAVSSVPYATAIQVPPPRGMRDEVTSQKIREGGYRTASEDFEDLDVPVQAAVIALALERALAEPAAVPRTRVEAMLAHAKAADANAGAADKAGTSRLVAMLEGALKAWP